MNKLTSFLLAMVVLFTAIPFSFYAIAEETLLGEENENPAFTMDITAPEVYYAGEEVSITVTVNNLNIENGLQHVRGNLYFDTDILGFSFELKEDKELKNSFRGYYEWTSMSKLMQDDEGRWYIWVDAVTTGIEDEESGEFTYTNVTEDGVLVFDFTFIAKSDAKGDTSVYIPHSTVLGDFCDFETFEKVKYFGNGSGCIIAEGDIANKPTEDQPSEDESESDESDNSSKESSDGSNDSSDNSNDDSSEEESEPEESAPPIEDENILGEENPESAFTLDITAPQKYIAGKKVKITVTVNNVNAATGLQHVHGKLYFNPEILGFDFEFKVNKELKKTFAGYNEWEGFSKLCVDSEGRWYVAVDAATSGIEDDETGEFVYSNVTEDGILVFTYTFIAKADAEGDALVYIPHASVIGDYYHPTTFEHTAYVGSGSGASIIKDTEPHFCEATGDWQYDKKNHWKLCSCEDELEKAAHEMEWVVTAEADICVDGEQKYMCKTCGYVSETETIPAKGLKGDINENGLIDSMDYIYLKRAYFGTFILSKPTVGDLNDNDVIDSMDYIYLKRMYFGTYVLNQ